jgi:hypothetical protein
LLNEGLYHLCSSKKFPDNKKEEWVGRDVVQTGERRGTWRVSVGKPERKKQFGRPRHRWEDIIETHLKAVEWGVDFIDLAQGRDTLRAIMIEVMTLRCHKITC